MGIFPPESGDTLFEVNAYAAQTKINAFVVADAFGTALLRRYGTELSNAEYGKKKFPRCGRKIHILRYRCIYFKRTGRICRSFFVEGFQTFGSDRHSGKHPAKGRPHPTGSGDCSGQSGNHADPAGGF